MSKIGVGIGEDFPVDEDTRTTNDTRDRGGDGYAEWAAHCEARRQWREQRREWRRSWRQEWRTHRRRFREQFEGSYRDNSGSRPAMVMGHPFFWDERALWRAAAVIGVVALIVFAISHIYFILGALVIAALCIAAYRHGFDPFDIPPHEMPRRDLGSRPASPAEGPREQAN